MFILAAFYYFLNKGKLWYLLLKFVTFLKIIFADDLYLSTFAWLRLTMSFFRDFLSNFSFESDYGDLSLLLDNLAKDFFWICSLRRSFLWILCFRPPYILGRELNVSWQIGFLNELELDISFRLFYYFFIKLILL